MKHVSELPLKETKFKFEKYTKWSKRVKGGIVDQMVSMLPEALMDRLGEELRDAYTGLSSKAEGREVPWAQGSGEGKLWPASPPAGFPGPPPALLHTQLMEKPPWCPSLRPFPCSLWVSCLPGQWPEGPSSPGQEDPPSRISHMSLKNI